MKLASGEEVLLMRMAGSNVSPVVDRLQLTSSFFPTGLRDPNNWNRVETMSAIMEMGKDAGIFETAIDSLRNDADGEVRDRAEKTLRYLRLRR